MKNSPKHWSFTIGLWLGCTVKCPHRTGTGPCRGCRRNAPAVNRPRPYPTSTPSAVWCGKRARRRCPGRPWRPKRSIRCGWSAVTAPWNCCRPSPNTWAPSCDWVSSPNWKTVRRWICRRFTWCCACKRPLWPIRSRNWNRMDVGRLLISSTLGTLSRNAWNNPNRKRNISNPSTMK